MTKNEPVQTSTKTKTEIPPETAKVLTSAHEDYLKAIYILIARETKVTNSALANYMGVSPASATNMVKKLAILHLVEHTPYYGVTLTESGERVALEVLRHHRLLELYLHQELNMPWDQVHEEAERLEHVISESLEDAIAEALGNPTVDPHGDPIPSKEGHVEKVEGTPLNQAELRQPYQLVRVLLQDQKRLSYLGTLGLYPNTMVTVMERAPFDGPLLLDVNGEHHVLANDMAALLLVGPIKNRQSLENNTARKSLRGLWQGNHVTAEEIDEARTEMWSKFPREDSR